MVLHLVACQTSYLPYFIHHDRHFPKTVHLRQDKINKTDEICIYIYERETEADRDRDFPVYSSLQQVNLYF